MDNFHYEYHWDLNDASSFLPFIVAIIVIVLTILLLSYILKSVGLMKIAKRENMKNSWLSFVPIANNYILGKIAFEDKIKALLFVALPIILSLSSISTIMMANNNLFQLNTNYTPNTFQQIICVVTLIFNFYVQHKLFKKYSEKAITMTIFSILSCNLLAPIFIFAIRNNELQTKIDVK